ncbi:(2Fe-2S) ferredoxin domain-containing protein [Candidatus Methylospira mobilis]|uniref:(2Fe-2S) ferredoxin domain-containing protein n=1 Tax=Candidatus Methylospira mobilis TaxID=1808979 RepID=A0A5Q0BIK1_9GAMM|nr:(2Fe-2S) ferredoxin domain-containing protein [Candidatus Methylospira mobilis]QFY41984.1 (2Fe-2S) ferredoxin domain-containing protein [Candidatus Methylospira mobilis]WNV02973.1 (2Fe-2S) ferredoxin domain-containing protein [Candidatus Methylospira mobilis]
MPKPSKHVFVCVQRRQEGHPRGCCAQQGGDAVMNAFLTQIQQRNLFNTISVTNTGCLGPCSFGASVLVYPEGIMYGKVTPEDVPAIIDEHLLNDVPVERLKVPEFVWG